VPVLLNAPEHVGHVAELVEHAVSAFATTRTLKREGAGEWSREEIRKELTEACERGAFVRLLKLVKKLRDAIERHKPRRWEPSASEAQLRRARTAAKQTANTGGISAAMNLLESSGCAPATRATFEKLVELTPKERIDQESTTKDALDKVLEEEGRDFILDVDTVKRCIKSAPKGKMKDLSGLRFEHLQQCVSHSGAFAANFLTLLFEQVFRHTKVVSEMITRARSVGVAKKDLVSIRPIGITSVLRRWAK